MDSSAIVYLSQTGSDAGACTEAAPCNGLSYAVSQTSATRRDIVFATGTYLTNTTFSSSTTSASSLTLHGNQSTLKPVTTLSAILYGTTPVIVSGFTFTGATQANAPAVIASNGWELDDVSFHDTQALTLNGGTVTVKNIHIANATGSAILVGATSHLVLDRGVISGGSYGVEVTGGGSGNGTFDITNLLVYGTTNSGLYLDLGGSGTIAFSTIANCGTGVTNSVVCSSTSGAVDTFTSSIIWNSDAAHAAVSGAQCRFTSTSIVGPSSALNATNVDPQFDTTDPTHPFTIKSTSPAKDAVLSGPDHDVDDDHRPQGGAWDLGAYEIP